MWSAPEGEARRQLAPAVEGFALGCPILFVGQAIPGLEACDLAEAARVLVPGGADPYRSHGLRPGDEPGLAVALRARLERLDAGLLYLVASLVRGRSAALGRFLEAVAEQKSGAGEAPRSVTDWVETHTVGETRLTNLPPTPVEVEKLAGLIGWAGPLGRHMEGYEPRPQQAEVLRQVATAFNENRHLLMEAPTGTGKSLAYLIPAAAWARQNDERVLIATHTIALQEQLLSKDLALLSVALGSPVNAAVLKGRSNYICLRKWEEEVQGLGWQADDGETDFYARISAWVGQTSTGDKAEVVVGADDEQRWSEIASETATCIGPRCKWFARHCFAHRARRQAQQAEVLITNHALLAAQLQQGTQAFPVFRRVVVDEAHHLEGVATEAFTLTCSFDQVQQAIHQLFSGVSAAAGGDGLLKQLARKLERPLVPESSGLSFPEGKDLFDLLFDVVVDARRILSEARYQLESFVRSAGEPAADGRPATLRLTAAWLNQRRAADARASMARLGGCLLALAHALSLLAGVLAARNEEAQAAGVRGRIQLLQEAGEAIKGALAARPDTAGWAEASRDLVIRLAPLSAGPRLREKLFDAYPSVALVSATLSVGGSFEFITRALGLEPHEVMTAQVDSPFSWKEQALLCAVDDGPAPRGASDPAYVQALCAVLQRLLPEVGGRCLVLFTANNVLRESLESLRAPMAAAGLTLLGQGVDGTVAQLVDRLKADPRTVVFGSGSFWEGIDVAGDALSCLVMTRLPFRPPTSPLLQARAEYEEQQGRNPFRTLSLPEAVIRFKQGFGRLIRTRTDRGVVIVLDSRILPGKSDYADLFLSSLPPISRIKGGVGAVIRRTREWLSSG